MAIPKVKLNRKLYQKSEPEGLGTLFIPRVTHRAGRQRSARSSTPSSFLIRCGCCKERFYIEYFDDPQQPSLEIEGVNADIQDWREVLLPLLGFEKQEDESWKDMSNK